MNSKITMKDLELDSKLIKEFRDTVNSNKKFEEIFENINNSNRMNAVYSAMDWISVGVEGTKSLDIKLTGIGYDHKNSLALIQYIIMIDQIQMSIKLLHDIINEAKIGSTQIQYPFSNTDHIFNKPVIDDMYFKHLRAAFGMHPTDLYMGVNGIKSSVNKRFYASWPSFDILGENDFIIEIYNDTPGYERSETLGIKLEELNNFVQERYQTLVTLTRKVSEITYTLDSTYLDVPIQLDNNNVLKDLKVLKEENDRRMGNLNGGYEYLLSYLEYAFQASMKVDDLDIDKNLLENYNTRLVEVMEEIQDNLEKMNRNILRIGILARGYEFEKIGIYLMGEKDPIVGEEYFTYLVKDSQLPNDLIDDKDFNRKRYIYDAFLYSKMDEKDELIYKNLLDNPDLYTSNGHFDLTGYAL